MKLQLQPNRWSCLPTAFAMILDRDVQDIFDFLGHDGSEILWEDLDEPLCRRSFHIQEMLVYAERQHNAHFIEIEDPPIIAVDEDHVAVIQRNDLDYYLRNHIGVLCGEINEHRHAVAWYNNIVYDPSSALTYDRYAMDIEEAYFLLPR